MKGAKKNSFTDVALETILLLFGNHEDKTELDFESKCQGYSFLTILHISSLISYAKSLYYGIYL